MHDDVLTCYDYLCLLNPWHDFGEENLMEDEDDCGVGGGPLPQDFDPIRAYHTVFDTLDMPEYGPGRVRFKMDVPEDTLEEVAETLLDLGSTTKDVERSFQFYRLAIRSEDNLERRATLIGDYEYYRDLRSGFDEEDIEMARAALEEARNEASVEGVRLIHYQRAIFHTHLISNKCLVRQEYVQYCRELI